MGSYVGAEIEQNTACYRFPPDERRTDENEQFGMPLYRQAGLLCRFGGDISSNTIAASIVRVGLATQPVINLMRDALLEADLIYCDETTFQVLKEKGRKPQTKS